MSLPMSFAIRQTWRDFRSGDLRLLGLAVVIAVAAISSVGFLSDRVSRALERDATRMLGADLVVQTPMQADAAWLTKARDSGLKAIRTWSFPSMVGAQNGSLQLASIKAVEQGYPLRGELRISKDLQGPDVVAEQSPAVGTVWVDPQILVLTGLSVGDVLNVGRSRLIIDRLITYEPDREMRFVNVAPRVLMRSEDLASSGLIGPGSRVAHSLLVAGETSSVKNYQRWLEPQLNKSQQVLSIESGRPEIARTLERANEFLTLVVMIAVLIAAVAVALGARRFSQKQQSAIAVMRCFGATSGAVTRLLMVEFILVALIGSLLGLLLGWLAQVGLVSVMQSFIRDDLPAVGWRAAAQGLYAGFWLLFAFSLPPLQALRKVSAAQILRREVPAFPLQSAAGYLVAFVGFALLMWWVAGNLSYGFGLAAGFVVAGLVFGFVSYLALRFVNRIRPILSQRPAWRFALSGLVRRKASSVAQICALAVGTMAILLLTIVRTDLLQGWQQTLPTDAPNRFLINIQPDQRQSVRSMLEQVGLKNVIFYPMVRGRLIERNGSALRTEDYESPRAQRLLQRDFNLSYADSVPDEQLLTQGRQLDPSSMELSMEQGIAKLLGIELGDEVVFDVAGQSVKVKLTSLRQVDWDSMKPNFFAILSSKALLDQPQTYITSFYLPSDQARVTQALVREFPNLTVFDLGALLAQLQSVLDRVSVAIEGLFVFSVLAGTLVLAAALGASRHERVREAALLRAIGATNQQLSSAQRIELLTVGALAGLLAAFGAIMAAWALSTWVFEFAMQWSVVPWLLGLAICMPGAWLAGSLVLRGVLKSPPLLILRHE